MIWVLSLNPCIDKTVALERFEMDSANRVKVIREDAGGKGMNVARMLKNLGAKVRLHGFTFAGTPAVLEKALADSRVPAALIPCPGALRVNLKIQDASRNCTIEINEESAPVTPFKLQEMENQVLSSLQKGDYLVLTGSLPKGAPAAYYRTLCEKAHEKGCFVAADCDGEALREVLKAAPDLIKPNEQELRKLLNRDISSVQEALPHLRKLLQDTGVSMICHSRGKEGALMVTRDEAVFCPTIDVPVRGVYGAGDAMLAAVCHALADGQSASDALCLGVSASCATIMLPGTSMAEGESVRKLLARCTPIRY